MMTNLFSTFDPSSNIFNIQLNWISSLMGMLFIPCLYWTSPNRYILMWYNMMSAINLQLNPIMNPFNNMNKLMFISLMLMIMLNNLLSLFPYIFSSPSHLTFTLTLALPLWTCFMIFGWTKNYSHMFLHLVPQGTPPPLMPFMVCIETISNIIRPMTLAVRLMANMIAGHLLLTLLGNTNIMAPYYLIMIILIIQIMLLMLESAVAIIQSYVFTILSSLYSKEMMETYDKSI